MSELEQKILSTATTLSVLLKQSSEYQQYIEAKAALLVDQESVEILSNYRAEQSKLQMQEILGTDMTNETQELDSYYDVLMQNELIAAFLQAENGFSVLMFKVQNILEQALNVGAEQCMMHDGYGETILN